MIMIHLTKLNGCDIVLNAELIESLESTPDTVINLVTGNRMLVKNAMQDVIDKIIAYKQKVYAERKIVNPIEGFEKK